MLVSILHFLRCDLNQKFETEFQALKNVFSYVQDVRRDKLKNSCDVETDLIVEPMVVKNFLEQRMDFVDRQEHRRLLPDALQRFLSLLKGPSVDWRGKCVRDTFLEKNG